MEKLLSHLIFLLLPPTFSTLALYLVSPASIYTFFILFFYFVFVSFARAARVLLHLHGNDVVCARGVFNALLALVVEN